MPENETLTPLVDEQMVDEKMGQGSTLQPLSLGRIAEQVQPVPARVGETPEQAFRRHITEENARGREVFTGYKMPVNYPDDFLVSIKMAVREMWESHSHENVLNLLTEYFNIPRPIVTIGTPKAVLGGAHYTPETATIALDNFSIVSLLHEYRHHIQYCTNQSMDEVDARIFSVSLYARVFPVLYQKMAQSGRLIFS